MKGEKQMSKRKKGRTFLAILLSLFMMIPGNGMTSFAAGSISEITEEVSDTATQTDAQTVEQTETQADEPLEKLSDANVDDSNMHLNYLVVGHEVVCTPEEQYVLADVGDGTADIEHATLTYENMETKEESVVPVDVIDEGSLLFRMEFDEAKPEGEYLVTEISVISGGNTFVIDMEDTGIEAKFGINTNIESKADAYVVEESEEEDMTEDCIQVLDADGQEVSFDNLADALEEANQTVGDTYSINKNLVVVLDPGHGGSDSGAVGYGLQEKDLCLKIAYYCKAKLEEYSHVEVYMTRTADTTSNIAARVEYAATKNPDIFVCIHINAGGGSGAEVYYPNGNYIPAIGTEGKELAEIIQKKLVALGLYDRGILIRNTENGSEYPDGSPQDYLGVIQRSKRAGFPAVLIEHGFVDNAHDAALLASESKLKEMGEADALSIAEYYGLSKDGSYGTRQTIADQIRQAYEGGTNKQLTPIMGAPSTSVDRMVRYYKANATFPDYYKEHDAEIAQYSDPLRIFCQIYYDEAKAEGVDPGVAFAQAMMETGFLRFGNDVKIEQYNFCGLGATGNGEPGNSFSSVRMGVRAQIQHLKAYASLDALNRAQVDPRFAFVIRGSAEYVEYLGIQENPFGKGWATGKDYGYNIVNRYMANFCDVKTGDNLANATLRVSYSTHVQSIGWQQAKYNGVTSGTTGLGKRLEAIRISVDSVYDLGITYQTHVQTYGWKEWATDGDVSGTTGEAKRLEAIRIKLTGADADKFDVFYRVHAQTFGWLGWAKNGQTAGTTGFAKRLEAIQIYVVPKGVSPQVGTRAIPYVEYGKSASEDGKAGLVNYETHVQTYGDQPSVSDGSFSGTFGESKRLEAIKINVNTKALKVSGGITYRTHVQKIGWQGWVSDGALSGTTGEAKRLEAIEIKLTGELAEKYNVYYRVHAQTYGWLNWAKNGEPAGTAGLAKRLEGIQIVLVPKKGKGPSATPLDDKRAFIEK